MYGVRDPRPLPLILGLIVILAAMYHNALVIEERWPQKFPFFDAERRQGYFFGLAQEVVPGHFVLFTDIMDDRRVDVYGNFTQLRSDDAVTVHGVYAQGRIEATGLHVLGRRFIFMIWNTLGVLLLLWAWRDAARHSIGATVPSGLEPLGGEDNA
ncbi:MAG: hypothetical protein QF415_08460 [Candidatus Undinarchaeales archaeon]|jgi:hypothetical protein|nr:hypothetical protein [Candidatus Undinarchaeales archaeon]MDP7493644.1 hypothetical protein [Candidatus Undinarchaeales archaeon]